MAGKFFVVGGNIPLIEVRQADRCGDGERGKQTSINDQILRHICFTGDFAARGGFLAVDVCPPNDLIDEHILMSFCELASVNLMMLEAVVLTDQVLYDSIN